MKTIQIMDHMLGAPPSTQNHQNSIKNHDAGNLLGVTMSKFSILFSEFSSIVDNSPTFTSYSLTSSKLWTLTQKFWINC